MSRPLATFQQAEALVASQHKVLRNTYLLLGLTLLFGGLCAGFAMLTGAKPMGFLITLGLYFGLFFLVNRLANQPLGLLAVFALTGFLGYTLGPLLSAVTQQFTNGTQLIMTAMAGTGIIFFALSAYVLNSKRDFSYLGGFLTVGFTIALLAVLAAFFYPMPILQLVISAAFMLLASGLIMFETSLIISGGQTNYILATVSLYVAIFNVFVSLLQILSAFSGQRD